MPASGYPNGGRKTSQCQDIVVKNTTTANGYAYFLPYPC